MKACEINLGIKKIVNKDFEQLLPYFNELIEVSWEIIDEVSSIKSEVYKLSIIMLCHHQLEMIHGCKILFENGCFRSSHLQMRSILESFFYVRYIMQKDSRNRSFSYINEYRKQFSRFASKIDSSKLNLTLEELIELNKIINNKDLFKVVATERKRRPVQHWYSLFDGPKNFEELISRIDQENSFFYALYSQLSQTMHATDLYQRMELTSSEVNNISIQLPWTIKNVDEYLSLLTSVFSCHTLSLIELIAWMDCSNGINRRKHLETIAREFKMQKDNCRVKSNV